MTIERAGTVLLLLTTFGVLVVVGVSSTLSLAADDVYASIDEARGVAPQVARTEAGRWLSTRLAADVPSNDLRARRRRADQLAYRSERVREVASVAALAGLLVALLTGRPAPDHVRGAFATSSPAANTTSSGTV